MIQDHLTRGWHHTLESEPRCWMQPEDLFEAGIEVGEGLSLSEGQMRCWHWESGVDLGLEFVVGLRAFEEVVK